MFLLWKVIVFLIRRLQPAECPGKPVKSNSMLDGNSTIIYNLYIRRKEGKMPLDMKYLGREFEPFIFTVDRSKIKEMCMAIGDANPVFFDREAAEKEGYKDTPAPLTFPTAINFWGYPEIWEKMKEIGIDTRRLLHAKEEYEYFHPVYPGDEITGTVSVDALRNGAMEMATFKSTYRRGDEIVCVAKMMVVIPPKKEDR